ncbi:MAG: sugar ABC transporter ATP-binding protein [Methylobacteriaceae bacterium]|nr:sugar ABC transporter ATP-binding protein [Methylobacteriaceae bacterium]
MLDAPSAPLLGIRGIGKSFDGAGVLHGIDLDLYRGEVVALLGENGAGKSTLLNIVSGALSPDVGRLEFDGGERQWTGPRAAIDAGIAFVHQELSGVRALSVAENIFLGDYCAKSGLIDRRQMRTRSRELLAEVGAAHIDPGSPLGGLRIADQQAVEIAKALRLELKLLLLDEPTSSLTPHEAEGLFAVVRTLKSRGVTIVFISHRIEEALALCDRIVVLRDGRLVSDRPTPATDRARVIADMAGRAFSVTASAGRSKRETAVLSARGIGDGEVVEDVTFDLYEGEVLGLFGLVGSGRTETLQMLYGARPRTAGSLLLRGEPFAPSSCRAAIARGLAMLPEARKINGILPNRSVAENIAIAKVAASGAPGLLDARAEANIVEGAIGRLGIALRTSSQAIRTLSGGNQQKSILARCLTLSPQVLLLDEPTHGVDVRTKAQIYEIIRGMAAAGRSVLITSSEMLELMTVADRILVLSNGRAVATHEARQADPIAIMRDAFSLLGGRETGALLPAGEGGRGAAG